MMDGYALIVGRKELTGMTHVLAAYQGLNQPAVGTVVRAEDMKVTFYLRQAWK
jgi:hypothetical protein